MVDRFKFTHLGGKGVLLAPLPTRNTDRPPPRSRL